jgi:hypothetical protein
MKKRNIYFIGLVFLATALAGSIPIFAAEDTSSMTCDDGVVNVGDTDSDVWSVCGEPDSQSMNEWVYNFGPSQPIYTVIFQDGRVVRILESEGGE